MFQLHVCIKRLISIARKKTIYISIYNIYNNLKINN